MKKVNQWWKSRGLVLLFNINLLVICSASSYTPPTDHNLLIHQFSKAFMMSCIFYTEEDMYNVSFMTRKPSSDYGLHWEKIVVWCKIKCQQAIITWATLKGFFGRRYTWLFVEDYHFYVEKFLKTESVPFSLRPDSNVYIMSPLCLIEETVVDVFRIRADGPTKIQQILSASYQQKQWKNVLNAASPLLLKGFTLKIGVGHFPPLAMVSKVGNVTSLKGSVVDFTELIAKYLGFKYEFVIDETRSYGILRNGSWNGIIGMLHRKEIDLSPLKFILTAERLDVADFSSSAHRTSSVALIRKPTRLTNEFDITVYTKPFPLSVWITSLCIFVLVFSSFVLTFKQKRGFHSNDFHSFIKYAHEILWFTIYLSCQVGIQSVTKNHSGRITMIFYLICVIIIVGTYNSFLTATLTVKKTYQMYNTFDQLLDDGTYGISILRSCADITSLKRAESGTLARIWMKLKEKPTNFLSSDKEGFKKITEENFVYILSEGIARYTVRSNCSFTFIKERILHSTIHRVFQKNSPYKEAISLKMMSLVSAGLLKPLNYNANDAKRCEGNNPKAIVGIQQVVTCFLLLGCGLAVAFFALCLEICYEKAKSFKV